MNIPDVYTKLVNGLIEKTEKKQANWVTSSVQEKYVIFFPNFGLSIVRNENEEDGEYIDLSIFKNDGSRVDGFWIASHENDYGIIMKLFSLARISALSIDTAISEIESEISSDKIIGSFNNIKNGDVPF